MGIFLSFVLIANILTACSGDVLFRTQPCDDGMVRQGNACVVGTKSGAGLCKDPDLNKLQNGETITMCDGSIGEGKLVSPADCSKDGEQDCVAKSKFKAVEISKLEPTKISKGTVIGGVSGTLLPVKLCRNYSSLSSFDSTYPPSNLGSPAGGAGLQFVPGSVALASDQITFGSSHGLITNSPLRFTSSGTLPSPLIAGTTYYAIYVSSTVIQLSSVPNGAQIDLTTQGTVNHTAYDVPDSQAQYYDTIDDYNYGQATSPSNNPWSSVEHLCDATSFINVTSNAAPLLPSGLTPSTGNQPFTQIWQDQISGVYISNILYNGVGLQSWSAAVRTCESLNGGTAGDGWHLPTQKELMQLYINGISKVSLAGGTLGDEFWSSTGSTWSAGSNAWYMVLSYAYHDQNLRSSSSASVLCIR